MPARNTPSPDHVALSVNTARALAAEIEHQPAVVGRDVANALRGLASALEILAREVRRG